MCENCNYETKRKDLIIQHLKNKYPCKNQIIMVNKNDIENKDFLNNLKEYENIKNN
tara:strand:- start:380 stop:547 length:168 start_codon:yes stop_codon:yes gene_type:complete